MTRNITVGISDELIERMNTLTDVNWSAVTRDCIEQYIKQRTSEGLEIAISKVRSKRSTVFASGFEFLIKNIDKFDISTLEKIVEWQSADNADLVALIHELEPGFEALGIKITLDFKNGMRSAARELLERSK